ncbi:MAG: hypothetical protein LUQ65_03090 [Candidatus Helarchaeota archaeon]|nr:hypothetical protein [Candidatus Helarchaeota archaeon]
MKIKKISVELYPFGKRFAISMADDTDGATLSQIQPVYDHLHPLGIRLTKTVWPLKATDICGDYPGLPLVGDTLEDRSYREYCEKLHSRGVEIALHTASAGNSVREETIKAYDFFEEIFGHPPDTNIMHSRNKDNIYWGKYCVSNPLLARLIGCLEPQEFLGHKKDSPYYWGDICRERTKYVRLFATLKANTLAYDPATPYHDPAKPDVNWWFSTSFGHKNRLYDLLSHENLEKMARERGASIIHFYTKNYVTENNGSYVINDNFLKLSEQLEQRTDGWYVPVAELLDRIRAIRSLQAEYAAGTITIYNDSDMDINDLALNSEEDISTSLDGGDYVRCTRNNFNQICLGTLKSKSRITIKISQKCFLVIPKKVKPNEARLVFGHLVKVFWQFYHGRMSIKPGETWREEAAQ